MQFSSLLHLLLISTYVAGLPISPPAEKSASLAQNDKVDVALSRRTTTKAPPKNNINSANLGPTTPLPASPGAGNNVEFSKGDGIKRGSMISQKERVYSKKNRPDYTKRPIPDKNLLTVPKLPPKSTALSFGGLEESKKITKEDYMKQLNAKPTPNSPNDSLWERIGGNRNKSPYVNAPAQPGLS